MIAAELRQDLDKVNCVSVTIDASNRKERGHDGGNAPCTFIRGAMGAEVFFIWVVGNFMVCQDRLGTYLLQLFALPETSE